jgi:Ca2+-binding EF-hand superfamily protein
MKTYAKAAVALAIIAVISAPLVVTAQDRFGGHDFAGHAADGTGMHGRHGSGFGRGHGPGPFVDGMRGRMRDLLETYDTDGDGTVTQAEIDAARASKMVTFDTSGDGRLSLEEYQALWLDAMREAMVDRFQSHDDDGDGQVTAEEFAEESARLVERLDRNGDGSINADDLDRMRRAVAPADGAPPEVDVPGSTAPAE